MLKCPLYNEDMISQYVEGLLDEEESRLFERHLMECDICLKSVLDLKNDLFKMKVYDKRLYTGLYLTEAVFLIIKNRLLMIRDLGKDYHFRKVKESYRLKGKPASKNSYYLKGDLFDITIGKDRGDKFLIEFRNTNNRIIELFKENRLIEAHANSNRERLTVKSLEKGDYTVVISDNTLEKGTKKDKIKIRIS